MKLDAIVQARSKYNYPTGHVKNNAGEPIAFDKLDFIGFGSEHLFTTTSELDCYHKTLLNSEEIADVHLGIVSVQFWGRCFVRNRNNFNQAKVRARWLLEGHRRSRKNILENDLGFKVVQSIRECIANDNWGEAFWAVRDMPHMGVSFGSKLLAFIAPEKMGVYDSRIARFLSNHCCELSDLCSASFDTNIVLESPRSFRRADRDRFKNYSLFLQLTASNLNEQKMHWQENNNSYSWRAVDVERALFQVALSEYNK